MCDRTVEADNVIRRCSNCKAVNYCSTKCQKDHWEQHKVLCKSIKQLEMEKIKKCEEACSFETNLNFPARSKLLNLIGEQCKVSCVLEGVSVEALWDTGAQVSLVGASWLRKNVADAEIRDISEIVGREIALKGAAGADIPYMGCVIMKCSIADTTVEVPFLVSKNELKEPIVGYNVIAHLSKVSITPQLLKSFPGVEESSMKAVFSILQEEQQVKVSSVRLHKFAATVKAGASISVPCRINQIQLERKSPMLFEPVFDNSLPDELEIHPALLDSKKGHNPRVFVTVSNQSTKDIRLDGRTRLGNLFMVSSVTPAEVSYKCPLMKTEKSEKGMNRDIEETPTSMPVAVSATQAEEIPDPKFEDEYREQLKKISLPSELNTVQLAEVKKMLWEERAAFARNEDEIGTAEDLQMNIQTEDEIPVQKRYNSIPRPLYDNVKNHIEDMLNRGWITKSSSAWSSPVVIVRKSDGGIRLFCNFRSLNKKTIAD